MASVTGLVALKNCQYEEIPWLESLQSVQAICDELIVVDGGSTDATLEIMNSKLDKSRLTVLNFPWPDNFNWTQFALNYAYGKEHIKTEWGLFFTWDEIFPKYDFTKLDSLSKEVHYVRNYRMYVLGKDLVYPYIKKENIFRNIKDITFGIINHQEGPKSNFRDFGRLINCSKWFDGRKYIDIIGENPPYKGNYLDLLRQGQYPRGYRDMKRVADFGWKFYNTDVSFCSNENILKRKTISAEGYRNLPNHYNLPVPDDIMESYRGKIKNLLKHKPKKEKLPQLLSDYIDRLGNKQNIVRQLCAKWGYKW